MEEEGSVLGPGIRLVLAAPENGGDGGVGTGVEKKGTGACGVDALRPVALDEPKNADRRAKALLGVRARAQDDVDQGVGVGPDLGGVTGNPLMGPVTVAPM